MTDQYEERDIEELDDDDGHYSRHVSAMTTEKLNSKSAIAAELAYRDYRIKELEDALNKFEFWFGGSRYRHILKWKEKFALEQQAKGVEDLLDAEISICRIQGNKRSVIFAQDAGAYARKLRQKAEDL